MVTGIEFSHAVNNDLCTRKLALTGDSVRLVDTVRELLEAVKLPRTNEKRRIFPAFLFLGL